MPLTQGKTELLFKNFFAATKWHVGSQFRNQGWNSHPLHWKWGVLTTGLPGKSLNVQFYLIHPNYLVPSGLSVPPQVSPFISSLGSQAPGCLTARVCRLQEIITTARRCSLPQWLSYSSPPLQISMIQLPEDGQGKRSLGVGEKQRQTWVLWERGTKFNEVGFS